MYIHAKEITPKIQQSPIRSSEKAVVITDQRRLAGLPIPPSFVFHGGLHGCDGPNFHAGREAKHQSCIVQRHCVSSYQGKGEKEIRGL